MDAAARLELAQLWLFVVLALAGLLALVVRSAGRSNTVYWAGNAALAVVVALAAWRAELPASAYGLTTDGAFASLAGAAWSGLVLVALGLPVLLALGRRGAGPLFRPRMDGHLAVYVAVGAPLQELLFRGICQGNARVIFEGEAAPAIAFSTLCHAVGHLPWGVPTALAMVVPGLVWGVQMERDGCLLGVAVSHAVVGWFFVCATPLWTRLGAAARGEA